MLVTIPTDPRHSSLNLAQAVAIMAYESWTARGGEAAPLKPPRKETAPATSAQLEDAVRRLAAGALGDRLLQDPAIGERDALVP